MLPSSYLMRGMENSQAAMRTLGALVVRHCPPCATGEHLGGKMKEKEKTKPKKKS